jgi:type I restriction enzyme, R subunit
MSLHKEVSFKNEICAHLVAAGWIYEEGAAARYDRARALCPKDLKADRIRSKGIDCKFK